MKSNLTTSEIVKRFKDKFGDKFDYSKVEYKGSRTPVRIICPKHGEFQVLTSKISSNRGFLCPSCGREHAYESHKNQPSKTTEQFIEDARMVHGDKYDYSKVKYVNARTKVCIICPEHGEFWQLPSLHTASGLGCKKCGQKKLIGNNPSTNLTTDEFIDRAIKKHGNKFDYSKTKYVDRTTPVCIICPEHGEFYTTPSVHLTSPNGGCKKCRDNNLRGRYALTKEEFIQKAREVHGDKYDYSKVEYVNQLSKVCIICPDHGEFWQTPGNHLNGTCCPKCQKDIIAKKRTKSTEQFIEEAKKVYGDIYDYSEVKYVNCNTKVCVICPKHGKFWTNPVHFLQGHGCPTCGNNRVLTKENFILKAREVHGDKYDYSKVEFVDYHTPVCIICPKHGETWQTPRFHIRSAGCRECGVENAINGHSLTTEEFIKKAREVHGDKYDYSKVEYTKGKYKVCIICPEHGEFWQGAGSHLRGAGCPKCSGRHKRTTEEFIKEAREVHGDKYDYSKVNFVNVRTKVCIICPEHGEFWQGAREHLSGSGCPICSNGYTKQYKFNLLKEFESEYSFRAFLANSDINILQVILRNIESKYDPIKRDVEMALSNASNENPINALEKKYSDDNDESWAEQSTDSINDVDLDDDEAVSTVIKENAGSSGVSRDLDGMMRNFEEEVSAINRIEHMLTPEDRKYIMEKFLNDKRRAWMLERDESVK